ncbi:MAG: 6-phosphogluconolactonase [Saprospiraceae bacterium]|nr:MAG: 6-phosphogluconolactonase [Saprospiraceae bacterium]
MKKSLSYFVLLCALIACQEAPPAAEANSTTSAETTSATTIDTLNPIFVGTYTKKEGHVDGKAKGIYTYHLDAETGKMKQLAVTEGIINPSFVTLDPTGQRLYAVSETGNDVDSTGYVYAYSVDPATKALKFINRQPTHGLAPCHASVTTNGQLLIVTNYVGGVVTVLPIQTNGGLSHASDVIKLTGKGPDARQEGSHPHSVFLSKNGTFAYVPDLGTDKVMIYGISYQTGELLPAQQPFVKLQGGSGPRHLVFHPYKNLLYVLNELNNTITTMTIDRVTGGLTAIQAIRTIPADFKGKSYAADIHITPDGHLLYASNRGHNSLAIFEVESENGRLISMGHEPTRGDFPRNFMIDDQGRFLLVANQNSDNIVSFKINPNNGQLTQIEDIPVPSPVCLQAGKVGAGRY